MNIYKCLVRVLPLIPSVIRQVCGQTLGLGLDKI